MVLQEMIRYEPDAVGLKPSAMGSEARLRRLGQATQVAFAGQKPSR